MNQKIKDALGVAGVVALLGAGYAAVGYVGVYERSTEAGSRSFSVSGEGKVVTVPDVAQFSFTVLTEGGKDIGKIQKENTEKSSKAIAFLKEQGVDAKDIRTMSYNLEPRYQYYNCGGVTPMGAIEPCPPSSIVGYTIRQSAQVKVRDFTKIGSIMSGVVENGANEVGSLNFTIDDPSKPRNEARAEAIAKARASAEATAKASGFRLGRLLFIDEGGSYPYYDAYGKGGMEMGISAVAPRAALPIEPGSSDVTVNVTLRYEIR
jgi:hypothetical protein